MWGIILVEYVLGKILRVDNLADVMVETAHTRARHIGTYCLCAGLRKTLYQQTVMERARRHYLELFEQGVIHICPFQPGDGR